MEFITDYLVKGFIVMLSISLPCVSVAVTVGLTVGIMQTVTSIHEQSLTSTPKIIMVFTTIVALGGVFLQNIGNYINESVNMAFNVVTKEDNFVLPSNYYKYTRPFSAEMQDKINKDSSLNSALLNQNIPWDKKAMKKSVYVHSKQVPNSEANFIEKIKIQKGN